MKVVFWTHSLRAIGPQIQALGATLGVTATYDDVQFQISIPEKVFCLLLQSVAVRCSLLQSVAARDVPKIVTVSFFRLPV